MTQDGDRRVLVVVAHPDDAEFTCAGTVAKWAREGWEVYYALVTSGDKGSHDLEMTSDRLAVVREEEQLAAARVLGVRECVFLRYQDGFVEDTPELRAQVVRVIRRFKPKLVVTWDPARRAHNHRDHRITGQVTMDAVYPLSRSHLYFPEQIAEGLEPHQCNEMLLVGSDQPNYYVDISDVFEVKVEAAFCHSSQMRSRSREEYARLGRQRARQVGRGRSLAEAFRRVSFARGGASGQDRRAPWWRLDRRIWSNPR